jgi:hypothetical protein
MAVEEPQVVGRERAELTEQPGRELAVGGEGVDVLREELAEHVASVKVHGPDPRQVVEADLVHDYALGRDVHDPRDRSLEADRHVAQPDGPVPGVQQRARDDPDGIREVDDPSARGRQLPGSLGDLEHHRNRAQGLREPTRAGGLLADAAEGERNRLVSQPGRLATHPYLHEHEVGALKRSIEVAGDRQ